MGFVGLTGLRALFAPGGFTDDCRGENATFGECPDQTDEAMAGGEPGDAVANLVYRPKGRFGLTQGLLVSLRLDGRCPIFSAIEFFRHYGVPGEHSPYALEQCSSWCSSTPIGRQRCRFHELSGRQRGFCRNRGCRREVISSAPVLPIIGESVRLPQGGGRLGPGRGNSERKRLRETFGPGSMTASSCAGPSLTGRLRKKNVPSTRSIPQYTEAYIQTAQER